MRLFFAPGACSLAPHIVLIEMKLPHKIEKVDLKTKLTSTERNILDLSPKGYVPILELENGKVLTEAAVILQYLGDQKPEMNLIPAFGTFKRYQAEEWLNYTSSEIHKLFSPLFASEKWMPVTEVRDTFRSKVKGMLAHRFDFVQKELNSQDYILGEQFSVCDAYLFTILSWASTVQIEMARWPKLLGYLERIKMRDSTLKAMEAEGLNKK